MIHLRPADSVTGKRHVGGPVLIGGCWVDNTWWRQVSAALRGGVTRRQVVGGLAVPTLAAFLLEESAAKKNHKKRRKRRRRRRANSELRVMSRNIYLGADLNPLFVVTSVEALIAAGTALFATVKQTDFPARAKLLAAEIEEAEPHIVGLQEVSLWRTQTPSSGGATPTAQTVAYDFLATLLDELKRQGMSYSAVSTVENCDGQIPIMVDTGL